MRHFSPQLHTHLWEQAKLLNHDLHTGVINFLPALPSGASLAWMRNAYQNRTLLGLCVSSRCPARHGCSANQGRENEVPWEDAQNNWLSPPLNLQLPVIEIERKHQLMLGDAAKLFVCVWVFKASLLVSLPQHFPGKCCLCLMSGESSVD